jgi:hypothetical protein
MSGYVGTGKTFAQELAQFARASCEAVYLRMDKDAR